MQGRLHFLAAALALGLVTACAPSPEREREAIERELLAHPDEYAAWQAIMTHYPAEYAALVERVRALGPGKTMGSPRTAEVVGKWLIAFLGSIGRDAAHASAARLKDLNLAELRLIENLELEAPAVCAAFVTGGGMAIPQGPGTEGSTAAMGEWIRATVLASAEGRDRPVEYAEPAQAERDKALAGVADFGVAPEAVATAISDPAMLEAMNSKEVCALGVAVSRSVARLPEASIARILSSQIRERYPQPSAPQRRNGNTRR